MLDFFSQIFFEQIAHSLISSERPEQIAHGPSFVLSDLSDSITVAHWETWVIRSQSLIWFERNEQNERIPSPGCFSLGTGTSNFLH